MKYSPVQRYADVVDDNSGEVQWPDTLLSTYGQMMTARDVALALNIEENNVRLLIRSNDPDIRMPGVKLGKSWRVAREELRRYLLAHHNSALDAREVSHG
jgi:hypothetical protein